MKEKLKKFMDAAEHICSEYGEAIVIGIQFLAIGGLIIGSMHSANKAIKRGNPVNITTLCVKK